eukprot:GHVT01100532.1.p1 GENE.GHVT01100532.1~~GHVT01100532.1.p1  ORF type:complete len:451 (-),score=21.29 GHVT01100532.1:737-2089(-)
MTMDIAEPPDKSCNTGPALLSLVCTSWSICCPALNISRILFRTMNGTAAAVASAPALVGRKPVHHDAASWLVAAAASLHGSPGMELSAGHPTTLGASSYLQKCVRPLWNSTQDSQQQANMSVIVLTGRRRAISDLTSEGVHNSLHRYSEAIHYNSKEAACSQIVEKRETGMGSRRWKPSSLTFSRPIPPSSPSMIRSPRAKEQLTATFGTRIPRPIVGNSTPAKISVVGLSELSLDCEQTVQKSGDKCSIPSFDDEQTDRVIYSSQRVPHTVKSCCVRQRLLSPKVGARHSPRPQNVLSVLAQHGKIPRSVRQLPLKNFSQEGPLLDASLSGADVPGDQGHNALNVERRVRSRVCTCLCQDCVSSHDSLGRQFKYDASGKRVRQDAFGNVIAAGSRYRVSFRDEVVGDPAGLEEHILVESYKTRYFYMRIWDSQPGESFRSAFRRACSTM